MHANGTAEGTNGHGELLPARRNHSLKLTDMQELAPPPSGLGAWAEKLRAAAYDAVGEQDVATLMKNLMKRAQEGDLKAAKFVMDFLTGGQPKVQVQQVLVHKRSRSTQRQRDREPAEPPAPVVSPSAPGTAVYRRLAALFLAQAGPSPLAAVAGQLELGRDEAKAVLGCGWFRQGKGEQWELTPEGRQVVG